MVTKDSEKKFSQRVYDLARALQWKVVRFPTWTPTYTSPGFPDLTMVRGNRLVFAELKMPGNRASELQRGWLDALDLVAEVYVWYPNDWEDIVKILERKD